MFTTKDWFPKIFNISQQFLPLKCTPEHKRVFLTLSPIATHQNRKQDSFFLQPPTTQVSAHTNKLGNHEYHLAPVKHSQITFALNKLWGRIKPWVQNVFKVWTALMALMKDLNFPVCLILPPVTQTFERVPGEWRVKWILRQFLFPLCSTCSQQRKMFKAPRAALVTQSGQMLPALSSVKELWNRAHKTGQTQAMKD